MVYAKFRDAANNVSTAVSDTIVLTSSTTPVATTTPSTTTTTPSVTTSTITNNQNTIISTPETAKTETVKMFSYTFAKDISLGMENSEVTELQKALKVLGYFTYSSATGYFGAITQTAVIDYQKAKGLASSGKFDLATRNSLNGLTKIITTSSSVVTPAAVSVSAYQFKNQAQVGVSGTDVTELQKILKTFGYFTYPSITGYFGNITKNAVMAYQKAKGLTQSGVLDSTTRNSLNGSSVVTTVTTPNVANTSFTFTQLLSVGDSGEEVKQLQTKLKALGYFTYTSITGYFGALTEEAVIKFQKANNLSPYPGYVGPGTRKALNK